MPSGKPSDSRYCRKSPSHPSLPPPVSPHEAGRHPPVPSLFGRPRHIRKLPWSPAPAQEAFSESLPADRPESTGYGIPRSFLVSVPFGNAPPGNWKNDTAQPSPFSGADSCRQDEEKAGNPATDRLYSISINFHSSLPDPRFPFCLSPGHNTVIQNGGGVPADGGLAHRKVCSRTLQPFFMTMEGSSIVMQTVSAGAFFFLRNATRISRSFFRSRPRRGRSVHFPLSAVRGQRPSLWNHYSAILLGIQVTIQPSNVPRGVPLPCHKYNSNFFRRDSDSREDMIH